MPGLKQTAVALADLDGFEKAVYCRKGEDRVAENDHALKLLLDCLRSLGQGAGFLGYAETDTAHYTRLASAIVALFCSRGFTLTQMGFNQIALDRSVLESVFKASVYNGSDFVFGLIPEDQEEGLTKYLMLFGATSELGLDLEAAFRKDPQATVGLWLSLVSYGQSFTPAADARREALLGMADIFKDVDLSSEILNVLCGAYMHCSYAHGEDKHAIKRTLHDLVAKHIGAFPDDFGPREPKVKPTVMIVFDWWWSQHAMYRCYAQAIESLKRDFRIVGIARDIVTDEEARAMFDDFHLITEDRMNLKDIAKMVRDAGPDILYFPSIGMSMVTIALASLRLAPVQVMSYGHPATSNSLQIDYGILESDVCTPKCFSETMIQLPPGTIKFVPYCADTGIRHVPRSTDVLKIGISAMQVKVTWPFIQALQEIEKRSKKRVEFHFFSAARGVGLASFTRQISGLLRNTVSYQMAPYAEYLAWLAECDVCLFGFPFGGANSVIDAFQMGMPVVSMEGTEPHSMTDASLMRRAGLPEHLIAQDAEGYIRAVLMMQYDTYRAKVAEQVRAVDVSRFFEADHSQAFVNAMTRIYRENCRDNAMARAA